MEQATSPTPSTKRSPKVIKLNKKLRAEDAEKLLGQHLSDASYDLLLEEDTDVYKPNGERLCSYRRGIVPQELRDASRPILLLLKPHKTNNRGIASGGERIRKIRKSDGTISRTTTAKYQVNSSIIGFFESYPRIPYCRQTAFNADNPEAFNGLLPYIQFADHVFRENVKDRYRVQMQWVKRTPPEWIIPGTAFTTITVNHNWPTAVHRDAGDLQQGFSCLTTLRRGQYEGGCLVFPEFRVAANMRDGDVILMDAHELHGNTPFRNMSADYERISTVLYFREKMTTCGTMQQELDKAKNSRGKL